MNSQPQNHRPIRSWRDKLHEIIFEADTPAGKLFDVCLLVAILLSVIVVCIETVEIKDPVRAQAAAYWFNVAEWVFTILFAIEYVLRVICIRHPLKYVFSFYGIIDLLAFLPTIVGALIGPLPSFAAIRLFRLLRVFRILKLVWLMSEAEDLGRAIWFARAKVVVFLGVVLIAVTIAGTIMYEVEGHYGNEEDFNSIPRAMYWAIVTMTTVGYGDIVPHTIAGKFIASALILLGYSLIIVPTGFISAEIMSDKVKLSVSTRTCKSCATEGHDDDAVYCKYCGEEI